MSYLSDAMKFALVALAATASALVAPASLRRPATALAVATAEVPVKSFDGADAGTATLSLKTTKGEKDMRVAASRTRNPRIPREAPSDALPSSRPL